jgi:hypothetical protein
MTYGKKIMVTLDNATRHDWFSPSDQPRTTGGFVADAGPPCYDETNMEDPEIGSGSVHPMTLELTWRLQVLIHHGTPTMVLKLSCRSATHQL